MLLHMPAILTADEVESLHARLLRDDAGWEGGQASAGSQAASVKRNLQLALDNPLSRDAQAQVLHALERSPAFLSAALPRRVLPPRFNRHDAAHDRYGPHVDQAIRVLPGGLQRLRADLSCTLFLSAPASYDGGELAIADRDGARAFKLPAGDALLYPAGTVHEVRPVTRGVRLASFFWIESMIRRDDQRALLHELDAALMQLREEHGDDDVAVRLTGTYHNLLRMWADA